MVIADKIKDEKLQYDSNKFTYSPSKKQIRTIKSQGEKQIKAIEGHGKN